MIMSPHGFAQRVFGRSLLCTLGLAFWLPACAPPGHDLGADIPAAKDDETGTPLPPCNVWGEATAKSTVEDPTLDEISGIAASALDPNLLWVHVDSGGPALLVGLGTDGRTRARVTLSGVTNQDWEDIAIGPCGDESCIFVGEFGDNSASRSDAAILRLAEPNVGEGLLETSITPDVFPFVYEEGPRDAESLVVGADGLPVIIDKRLGEPATLHRMTTLNSATTTTLEVVGSFGTGAAGNTSLGALPTAADLHPGGDRLLLRTYTWLWEYHLGGGGLTQATDTARVEVNHGPEIQGEAAAYARDGRSIWHVSEGSNPVLYRVPCNE
jgi:hypothetical protein